MPISPALQEKKRSLLGLRTQHAERFKKVNGSELTDSQKHDVLEEIKRAEPDILKLAEEVREDEKILIAEQKNEDELKALMAPDRRTPFSVEDAARGILGTQVDVHHMRGLGEMIAQSEAVKTFREGVSESGSKIRRVGVEFNEFKSLKDGFWNPRSADQIEEAMSNLSPEEARAVKATFASAGLTSFDRVPGVVLRGVEIPRIGDLIPQGETTASTIRYVREVAFTPSAAAVAENGLKPEASWSVIEADAGVKKIAVRTKMTEELMDDFPAMRDYINQRLPFMVEIEEDNQLLNGDGTGANIRGVLNTTGILTHTQGFDVDETTVVTGDSAIDAMLRAATRVQFESFFEPTGIVLNAFKWMNIRLTRTGTGDDAGGANRGLYLLGNPTDQNGPTSLWGYPLVPTTRVALNMGVVAAWNLACQIFRRKGISVDMTNANEDDYNYNRVTVRAEERFAFPVYRPQGICKVVFNGVR